MLYSGTGCPDGSVAHDLSPDGKALTLIFDGFVAETSPEVRAAQKGCAVALRLHAPEGWSYALFSVDYRGYVKLGGAATSANLSSWYAFGSGAAIKIANIQLVGPVDRDYQRRGEVALNLPPWRACLADAPALNIGTSLTIAGPHGLMTIDSIDGQVRQKYAIAWRRCPSVSSWQGKCRAVMRKPTGDVLSDYLGQAQAHTYDDAVNTAKSHALAKCETARAQQRRPAATCSLDGALCDARPMP